MKELFQKTTSLKSPSYLAAQTVSPLDKEYLFEHFLCLESFQDAGTGQAFVIDSEGAFLALINLKNHLQLQLFETSGDLLSAWNRLSHLETEIGQKLDYAFSPKFGFLTSDPSQCGTALRAVTYLHVPALHHTGKLHETLKTQESDSVLTLGLEGALDDLVGDFLLLKNRYTLGISEEEILQSLQLTASQLTNIEKALRPTLKDNASIKDLVSRAWGLLTNAYQLQTKEALNALSALKLGLDLGWISGISVQALHTLFFQCRRAHLAHLLQDKHLGTQDLTQQRAEFIKQALQGVDYSR